MTEERNGGGLTQRKIPEWMGRTGARILDDEIRITLARAAVAASFLGCLAGVTPGVALAASDPLAVGIDNFSFTPGTPTVKTGTTVTLTNRGDIPHTVTSTTRLFKSKPLDTDNNKLSFMFATPGSYEYFCSLQPHMTAKIVVEATTRSSGDHDPTNS
jgi:plastocyanin